MCGVDDRARHAPEYPLRALVYRNEGTDTTVGLHRTIRDLDWIYIIDIVCTRIERSE
jgi:hypothetical protein